MEALPMASIERTAYPRFTRTPTSRERHEGYTPTAPERACGTRAARTDRHLLGLLVLLKAFQRLGYFPRLEAVPAAVIAHLRSCLRLDAGIQPGYETPRTLYRHHQAIRDYLAVQPYGPHPRHLAVGAVYAAAQVRDHPPDLINVAIEELVRQRCELPAFSTLDRLVGRVRALVNGRLFATVVARLTAEVQAQLAALFVAPLPHHPTAFSQLTAVPKSSTLAHMQEWQAHHAWLLTLGDVDGPLASVPVAKIGHFAAQARALDADGMRDVGLAKRTTLLLCLIQRARVQARDSLATMFVKRLARIHVQAKEALLAVRERQRATTEQIIGILTVVAQTTATVADDAALGRQVRDLLGGEGGAAALLDQCEALAAYNGNNHLPLVWRCYRSHRSVLFKLVRALALRPTTRDRALTTALEVLLAQEQRRGEWLPTPPALAFASEAWRRTITVRQPHGVRYSRRHFEAWVFSYLAAELRSGDLAVPGSEQYADYREQLLPWHDCAPQVDAYCRDVGLATTAGAFVVELQAWLTAAAEAADRTYPTNGQVVISNAGEPVLKRVPRQESPKELARLEAALAAQMPERPLLDVLGHVAHWTDWTRHFGPPSGADPKLERARERYIITTFGYGCNLGPAQTARHTRGVVTPHMVSFVNQQHITAAKLDAATRDLINAYHRFDLPKLWGTGKTAAADGTKIDLYEQNLLSEYHIRYGGYGGIAYHHVSDTYIALVSHFIACGTFEALYIVDVLFTNTSDIQPETLHADTQGQTTPVFALTHLLGITLLPRIRNWSDLVFYRPSTDAHYQHIDTLFRAVVDWTLIETHWQDLLQVVRSIKAGKLLPSTLLRKLTNYSHKNRLYQAFRELGRVVRTVFLLDYIANADLRQQITAATNKAEAYNGLTKWLFFGGEGVIAENDPEEQEKRIKYTDLIANALILQNVDDMTRGLRVLAQDGFAVDKESVMALSPYLRRHIKRFGDYVLDLSTVPEPLQAALPVLTETEPQAASARP
jgi:TnpA family transposase